MYFPVESAVVLLPIATVEESAVITIVVELIG
jgi:hypothetical protein